MSEELQKEIDRLKAENAKLTRDLAGAHDDIKEVRGEARDRRHEGKRLTEQLEALAKERDEFKLRAELDPDQLKSQLAEAHGRLRDVAHRAAFAKVAQGLKVNDPAKVSDLYALSGYKAEADEPDEAKLVETIKAALTGRQHYLDPPPAPAPAAPAGKPAAPPAPGATRGQSVTSEGKNLATDKIAGRF